MILNEGDLLNQRYRILRLLSDKGGMGLVYQATDQNLSGTVVIKQSRFSDQNFLRQIFRNLTEEQLRSQAEFLQRAFEREAKLLFGLRHNALPRVLDYFRTAAGDQCLVMEFIPGKDFGDMLAERLQQKRGPFPLAQVLGWTDQLLDALDYLHTQFDPPIIHRDIKPQNLKLMPNGQAVLLDFGLAKGARPGMSVVAGSIHGHTPHYAPLEQIRGRGTDVRSDLYSLAATLYHLLTGQLPADAVERVTETISGGDDPLRPAHEVNAGIPAAISQVLQGASALSQNDRPQTAAALRAALRQAINNVDATPAEEAYHIQPQPPPLPQLFIEDLGRGVKLEMIYIPGGSFLMGSPDGVGKDAERPQHRVTLAPFYLSKYPVTQAQWQAVMGNEPHYFQGDDLPVESVSWHDALKFCEAISKRTGRTYRLPTEAEWEYACRAGSTGLYCFGDNEALLGQYAWYWDNSGNKTYPVGQKKPNAWGLCDMHGSVWEWCADDWHSNYDGAPTDGRPWIDAPNRGAFRVVRGGGWDGNAIYCRRLIATSTGPTTIVSASASAS